jgi:hypothetical protein
MRSSETFRLVLAYAIQEAVNVAKAAGRTVTTKEIHAILREGVLSGDPLYNIRQVPGLIKQVINQTGKQTAYWASGHTRQFSMMPKATFFSFEDPISSINDMKRLMENLENSQSRQTRHAFFRN